MSGNTKTGKSKKDSKKSSRKHIALKLAKALADLEKQLGKKRFATRVKKASKLFVVDVKSDKKSKKEDKPKLKKVAPKPETAAEQA
jgi:hypothetical protein